MAYSCSVKEEKIVGSSYTNSDGDTECVELVKQVCGAPSNGKVSWKRGIKVMDAPMGSIKKFVAIGTFNDLGHFKGHAAIYVSHSDKGIIVYDQWVERSNGTGVKIKNKPVKDRTIRSIKDETYKKTNPRMQNIAENYFVID